jgi:hypothetical protein
MNTEQLERVRGVCLALPEATEKLSHGEPTFFVRKKVFAMFANNHHNDGRIAVWLPVPPGMQPMMIAASPEKFFKPPYVGVRGWVGIALPQIDDDELTFHLHTAYRQVAPKSVRALLAAPKESVQKTRN